jgi:uncharacterized protein involved in cysteine biosynthesis
VAGRERRRVARRRGRDRHPRAADASRLGAHDRGRTRARRRRQVGSFFVDEIADHVERTDYPADPPGTALPLWRALIEGSRTALLAILVYLCALPFLLLAGFGVIIFFLATAYLLGREYFELAALRFLTPDEAKALRRRNSTTVFMAGLFIAAFVAIPIVNLATPLFAMAFMVHMHKRIAGGAKRELIEPARP